MYGDRLQTVTFALKRVVGRDAVTQQGYHY